MSAEPLSTAALTCYPQRGDARGIRVRPAPAAVPLARREFLADIAGKVDRETCSEAAVVVSELLGNAVRHARPVEGAVLLRWQVRAGTVDLEVTDGGALGGGDPPRALRPLRPAVYATTGRGLRIVRSLAHEWGVLEEDDGRRTVWAALGGPSRRRRRIP